MNERVIIEADGYNTLHDTLYRNNFAVRANQLVEISFAVGTGAFVEYLDAKGSPMIDYVRAEMIFPLSWDTGAVSYTHLDVYKRQVFSRSVQILQVD